MQTTADVLFNVVYRGSVVGEKVHTQWAAPLQLSLAFHRDNVQMDHRSELFCSSCSC